MSGRQSPALARLRAALLPMLSNERLTTLDRLSALGFPTPRDDAYRYTNFRVLDRRELAPALVVNAAQIPGDMPVGKHRLVFLDGRLYAEASAWPDSIQVQPEEHAIDSLSDAATDRMLMLNAALGNHRTKVVIPRNTQVSLDIALISTVGGAYPAISFVVEAGAELRTIEYQTAIDDAESLTVSALHFELKDGATVDHTLVQTSSAHAIVVGDVRARVGRDASYRHRSAVLGAQLSRIDLNIELYGRGASTSLTGLFLADGQREHHLRSVVRHMEPDCQSDQLYRGVANERGRGSYDGKVVVDVGANGTLSSQSSKNLLLSADAAIETRPQLEINADAVKCAHGATTGSLDERMMFYLLSRGLDRDTARAVLTYAFLGDVLTGFAAETRAFVEARALGRLPAADLIRGFVA